MCGCYSNPFLCLPLALFHIYWPGQQSPEHLCLCGLSAVKRRGTRSSSGEEFNGEIVLTACPWVSAQGLRLGWKNVSWQLPGAQGSPSSFTKWTHLLVYTGVTLVTVSWCFPLTPHPAPCPFCTPVPPGPADQGCHPRWPFCAEWLCAHF